MPKLNLSFLTIKEGYPALFFLIIAYLLALKSASSSALLVWWSACLLLLIAIATGFRARQPRLTPLSIAAILFGTVLLYQLAANTRLLESMDYLLGGWLLIALAAGMLVPKHLAVPALRYVVMIFVLLSLWALAQYHFDMAYMVDMGQRANAIFTTPNSFAAALNLVNLLLIVLYLTGHDRQRLLFVSLLLFAALLTTESRGGWITFCGGLVFFVLLTIMTRQPLVRKRVWMLAAGLLVVLLVHITAELVTIRDYAGSGGAQSTKFYAAELGRNMRLGGGSSFGGYRLQIYADAWQLIAEQPLRGHGFMTFEDHYSRVQSSNHDKTIHFVHNDYLQFWVETGLIGLLALLGLIAAGYWQAWRSWHRLAAFERAAVLGAVVALSSYFAHALVDFVFYIPALAMLAFGYMGYINRLGEDNYPRPLVPVSPSPAMARFVRVLLVVVPGWLLFEPALAQVVAQAGERLQKQGEFEGALTLYGMARRLAPHQSEYYRREAGYWLSADAGANGTEQLRNALELYADAAARNPFDLRSRMQLAYLNVRYREHIARPASREQIVQWLDYVTARRPWDQELAARRQALLGELDSKSDDVNDGRQTG